MKPAGSREKVDAPNQARRREGRFALGIVRRFFERDRPHGSRRVLFLDDDPARAEEFLRLNPCAIWVETVEACIAQLEESWDEVHLDHDLGGKTLVDPNQVDCGMEVIRWLCREPRGHLLTTQFFVHTHNSAAGLLMALQMRSSGYNAELRPFGLDLARLLDHETADSTIDGNRPVARSRRWRHWLHCLGWRHEPPPPTPARDGAAE
jgi:hypothetical protein